MKKILFALLFIGVSSAAIAQNNSNSIFSNTDVIRVDVYSNSEYFYMHEMKKGHSLYSLSKLFKTSLLKIYRFNGIKEGSIISIGQKIKIPLNDDFLYKGINLSGVTDGHFVPVYYRTKPKDNLFRISRVYFKQNTDDLIARNNLSTNSLSLGQDILIGWFPIGGKMPITSDLATDKQVIDQTIAPISHDTELSIEQGTQTIEALDSSMTDIEIIPSGFNRSLLGSLVYNNTMKETKKSEVAHWDNSMPDNGTVYVLHKNAIIDSYIEMYNPLLKRSVRAKVIGRIPYGAYTKDVCLVLSPRAAKHLGALDKRFKVEIKALIQKEK